MPTTTISTAAFGGQLWPPALADLALGSVIGGSPFADSLTRFPISANRAVFPKMDPTGGGWVAEGGTYPTITIDDTVYTVVPHSLGGILKVTREALRDTAYDLDGQFKAQLVDAFSSELDDGLLNGNGTAPNPQGVLGIASAVTGASLREAVATAVGDIGDAGGTPDTLALSFARAASDSLAVGGDGHLLYPAGLSAALGLNIVRVPALASPIVYDSTRTYLVVADDWEVAQSEHFYFDSGAIAVRPSGRFALAVPTPTRTVRKLTITP